MRVMDPIPCEHHWVSMHQPGHHIYWIMVCSICHEPDWDALDRSIDEEIRRRERGRIIAYKIFGDIYDPADVIIIRESNKTGVSDVSLEEHARRELNLCGQYDEDPKYSESIIRAVREFASYGHSGGSAGVAREQLHALLAFKTLSPITSDPEEWIDQSESSGTPMWQNRRDPSYFSLDGGRSWYSLDDPDRNIKEEEKTLEQNFQTKARRLVVDWYKDRMDTEVLYGDTYVVWFSKVLKNWKALVSTNIPDSTYFELTHDGENEVTYVDVYRKLENITVPDDLVPEEIIVTSEIEPGTDPENTTPKEDAWRVGKARI